MREETVLVTGAAGFIGPKVVRLLLERKEPKYRVIAIDKLTYAAAGHVEGKPLSLEMEIHDLEKTQPDVWERFEFVRMDVCDPNLSLLLRFADIRYVLHLAAESHVDRSIGGTPQFIQTEIHGTRNMLEWIRQYNLAGTGRRIKAAVFVSTDEVYGSLDRISGHEGKAWADLPEAEVRRIIKDHQFKESTTLAGGSPYAACKGGADLLVLAYFNTFKWSDTRAEPGRFPLMVTRGVNNYGTFQHPEKLIPMAICTLLDPVYDRRIPVYDQGLAVREWLSTTDHARGIVHVMENGVPGEVYNIGSGKRVYNRDILLSVYRAYCRAAKELGLPEISAEDLKNRFFNASVVTGGGARPGHDLAYAADCSKLQRLGTGWAIESTAPFENQIEDILRWYASHTEWWRHVWRGDTVYEGETFVDFWNKKYQRYNMPRTSFEFYEHQHLERTLDEALL